LPTTSASFGWQATRRLSTVARTREGGREVTEKGADRKLTGQSDEQRRA
jgi:hypothetical protein